MERRFKKKITTLKTTEDLGLEQTWVVRNQKPQQY